MSTKVEGFVKWLNDLGETFCPFKDVIQREERRADLAYFAEKPQEVCHQLNFCSNQQTDRVVKNLSILYPLTRRILHGILHSKGSGSDTGTPEKFLAQPDSTLFTFLLEELKEVSEPITREANRRFSILKADVEKLDAERKKLEDSRDTWKAEAKKNEHLGKGNRKLEAEIEELKRSVDIEKIKEDEVKLTKERDNLRKQLQHWDSIKKDLAKAGLREDNEQKLLAELLKLWKADDEEKAAPKEAK